MTFLYGDSSESGLERNYIDFLKAALDLAVEVLHAEHQVQLLHQGGEDHQRAAESELGELRQLHDAIGQTLDAVPGGLQGAAARCAAALRTTAGDAIMSAVAAVKANLSGQLGATSQQILRERASATRSLESFLLHHELPGGGRRIDLAIDGAGERYGATLGGRADLGLDWRVALDIPPGHPFAQPLRLERLGQQLEIRVPESGGWMRKGVRLARQRLASKYVTELIDMPQLTTFKLRATPHDDEAGFDVQVGRTDARIQLVRVAKGGERSPPFEPVDEDVTALHDLTAQLRRELESLAEHRKALVDALLDGKPLLDHEGPSLVVRRLLTSLVPVVHELARHSLSPDELVLKRILADGRREEIFVTKNDLRARFDSLPPPLRALFAPLGLAPPGAGGRGTVAGSASRAEASRAETSNGAEESVVTSAATRASGELRSTVEADRARPRPHILPHMPGPTERPAAADRPASERPGPVPERPAPLARPTQVTIERPPLGDRAASGKRAVAGARMASGERTVSGARMVTLDPVIESSVAATLERPLPTVDGQAPRHATEDDDVTVVVSLPEPPPAPGPDAGAPDAGVREGVDAALSDLERDQGR